MNQKTFRLKNKSMIVIRDLSSDDLENALAFFSAIPESQRKYFRSDVIDKTHLKDRAKQSESGKIIRRVAEMNGEIVGDTSLEIETDSWKSSSAYLRMVVPEKQ
ncbi:MAG: hypothetical protein QF418_04950, partial [Candidatus Marinimicrobia bacterium]|nr:hypothetical protein [Candidatus Neomarinimicrobiota bacterium]